MKVSLANYFLSSRYFALHLKSIKNWFRNLGQCHFWKDLFYTQIRLFIEKSFKTAGRRSFGSNRFKSEIKLAFPILTTSDGFRSSSGFSSIKGLQSFSCSPIVHKSWLWFDIFFWRRKLIKNCIQLVSMSHSTLVFRACFGFFWDISDAELKFYIWDTLDVILHSCNEEP